MDHLLGQKSGHCRGVAISEGVFDCKTCPRKHQLTDLDQACCCDETSLSFCTFLIALMVELA